MMNASNKLIYSSNNRQIEQTISLHLHLCVTGQGINVTDVKTATNLIFVTDAKPITNR